MSDQERKTPSTEEVIYLVGLLVGEGHFGGDGKQPHITLRMHTRHEAIFRWLVATFSGGKLYGPYNHGGRHYYQWMARGTYLRQELAPLIAQFAMWFDDYTLERFQLMCSTYNVNIAVVDNLSGGVARRDVFTTSSTAE